MPAIFLLGGRGDVSWQHTGDPGPSALASALDQHATPGARARSHALGLTVRPGDPAPDVLFTVARGETLALRKLRRRRVVLNFWKSWSAPCLKELDRLQRVHARAPGGSVVVAVNDGEDPARLEEIRRARSLSITLVADPKGQIAARYHVPCWPTTISIDERGRVEAVQFGAMPEREASPARPERMAT
jgi:peroxiredoxin